MTPKTAFLFPGQGSQSVGMGKELAVRFPVAAKVFEEADAILGWNLTTFAWEGPEDELRRTDRTQPALFVSSVASLLALREQGIEAGYAAGHSVGEYAALFAADVFDFETGLKLVAARSSAMHEASLHHPGGMAAILGMELAAVEQLCSDVETEHKGLVEVANLNSPGQVVISGEAKSLDLAIRLARMRGAIKVVSLPVAGAWHCFLMKSAEAALAPIIETSSFHEPKIPVIANVTAEVVTTAAMAKELLIRQVCGRVRWADSIKTMDELGVERYIEVGNGNVLSGLMKRLVKKAVVHRAGTPQDIETQLGQIKGENS